MTTKRFLHKAFEMWQSAIFLTWSFYLYTRLPIVSGDCPALTPGPSMNLTGTASYPGDPPVTVSCETGYKLDTEELQKDIACLDINETDAWNDTLGICVKKTCPEINVTNTTIVTNNHTLEFGAVASYRCMSGYAFHVDYSKTNVTLRVTLEQDSTCDDVMGSLEASWTNLPTCKELVCEDAPSIKYMKHTSSNVTRGSEVTYRCRSGYILPGGLYGFQARCNDTVSWEPIGLPYNYKVGRSIAVEEQGRVGCVYDGTIIAENTTDLWDAWLMSSDGTSIVQMCRDSCKEGGYKIAAINNSTCMCGQLEVIYYTNNTCYLECPDWDPDNMTSPAYCGGQGGFYTVFSSFDGCYNNIDESAYSVIDVSDVTYVTCREMCRGQNYSYAVRRGSSCFCLHEPIDNATVSTGKSCYGHNVYDLGKCMPNADSCSDLYDRGVRKHGQYLLMDPMRTEYCHFKDGTVCDEGWIGFRGNCYDFRNTSLLSFDDARQYCHDNGAEVASFPTYQELAFFNLTIRLFPDIEGNAWGDDELTIKLRTWWLGLMDTFEGMYTWLDGSLLTYPLFNGAEPNIQKGICADNYKTSYRAADCSEGKRVVCRKSNAYSECISNISATAVVYTQDNNETSLTLCLELCKGKEGATDAVVRDTVCTCLSGMDSYAEEPKALCNWPCPGNLNQLCGGEPATFTYLSLSDRVMARSCSELHSLGIGNSTFMVRAEDGSAIIVECGVPECPISWLDISGTCYKFITSLMTTEQAAQKCAEYDAYRIVFETDLELSDVTDTINNISLYSNAMYWQVGLSAASFYEGVFKWDTGKQTENGLFNYDRLPDSRVLVILNAGINDSCDCIEKVLLHYDKVRPICEKGSDYLGCYGIDLTSPVVALLDEPEMTIQQCVELCRAANLSVALLNTTDCHCVEDLDGLVPTTGSCTSYCPGQRYQACGGADGVVSAYDVNEYPPLSSCEELFDTGIFVNEYYMLNGSLEQCSLIDGTECESGWFGYRGYCYKYFPKGQPSEFATCMENNATMTSLTTPEEYDTLSKYMRQIEHPYDKFYRVSSGVTRGGYGFGVMMNPDGRLVRTELRSYSGVNRAFLYDTVGLLPIRKSSHTGYNANGGTVCKRHVGFLGCFEKPSSSFVVLEDFSSMELTLCKQMCLANGSEVTLLGSDFCACANDTDIGLLNVSNTAACQDFVSIHGYQLNGDGSVVLAHETGDATNEAAKNCQELYGSGVFYNSTYIINNGSGSSMENCGFTVGTDCPANWIGRQGTCYKFVQRVDATISNVNCFKDDSFLVSSTEPEVDQFVTAFMTQTALFTGQTYQTGVYCFVPGFSCVRADGTVVDKEHVIQYSGEDLHGFTKYNHSSGLWLQQGSLTETSFVCQKDSEYPGCFTLPSGLTGPGYSDVTTNSLTTCLQWCQGQQYDYAAVSVDSCQCLDNGTSLTSAPGQCITPCNMPTTQSCGGSVGTYTVVTISDRLGVLSTCTNLLLHGVRVAGTYKTRANDSSPIVYRKCFTYPPPYGQFNFSSVSTSSVKDGFPAINFVFSFPLWTVWKPVSDSVGQIIRFQFAEDYLITGLLISGLHQGSEKSFVTSYKLAYRDPTSRSLLFYEHGGSNVVSSGCDVTDEVSLCYNYMWHPIVTREMTLYPRTWVGSISMQGVFMGQTYTTFDHNTLYIGCCPDIEENFYQVSTTWNLDDCLSECRLAEEPFASIDDEGTCRCGSGCLHNGLLEDTECLLNVSLGYRAGDGTNQAIYRTYGGIIANIDYPYLKNTYTYGTQVHYVCAEGWESTVSSMSNDSIYCMQDNQWSALTLACQEVYCPVFETPPDGNLDSSATELLYGTPLTLTCDQSFWVEDGRPQMTVTCQQNHSWSFYPTCKREHMRKGQTFFEIAADEAFERLTGTLATTYARSRMDCASFCFQNYLCSGYNFRSLQDDAGSCVTFVGSASSGDLIVSTDWVYWERNWDLEPFDP